ncbi:hypothetical protein RHIZ404_210481 [Rhizobium sp. EC-SD404]|nr:hypothetical protein RHIZ404_210481 [Rhizobium sp. EC-SD404]
MRCVQWSGRLLQRWFAPVRAASHPTNFVVRNGAHRGSVRQRPYCSIDTEFMHAAVFGKPCHQARSVEGAKPSGKACEVQRGGVGKSHEDFRILSKHIQVEVWEEAYTVLAANRGDDSCNVGVCECLHQIGCPRLRVSSKIVGSSARVWHFDNLDAEYLFELPFPGFVPIGIQGRPTPRGRYGGDFVSSPQSSRNFQRMHHPQGFIIKVRLS